MTERSNSELVEVVEDVLVTILSLARDLTESDADRPTDCPGWTVRDQLAHVVGLEQVLAGAPEPTVELPPLDHVRNEIDAYMERPVHIRRRLPLSAIADELAGLLPRRVAQLREQAAQGDPSVRGPFGERSLSASLPIRAFDLWAHEQDIRRAVGLPVRERCAAADVALERCLLGWSAALPGRVEGADGELVVEVTAPSSSRTSITFGGGGPVATLSGDLATLTWLGCGRGRADDATLHGDDAVVAVVRDHLALTP